MTDFQALLFDLDGTLVDTAEANFAAYSAALAEIGIDVDRQAFLRAANGRHWREFLPPLLGSAQDAASRVAARKRELYREMATRTVPNQELVGLARRAKDSVKLALVTTASRDSASAVLAAHDLEGLFATVITGDDVGNSKPSPEPYLLAAARLAVEPSQCLVFEDSDIGMESARRAGMRAIRVSFEALARTP